MGEDDQSKQRIYLTDMDNQSQYVNRKRTRIELRALKDAYALKIEADPIPNEKIMPEIDLKRVTAYCTAESFDLKQLSKFLKKNNNAKKVSLYFGECLYVSFVFKDEDNTPHDCFFYDYGVLVCWGMEKSQETKILKMLLNYEINKYEPSNVEIESFRYGITEDPFIINDVIFLNSENYSNKLVISIAIAQSVKLDFYENLVDNTIDLVKELPDEVEKEGKVSKTRKEILKVIGKLHKLRISLNLVSNILDEPEFVWDFPAFSSVYETCRKYLDIKSRVDLLNKRCDVIDGILQILSENITTNNSERLEMAMIIMISANFVIGIIQIIALGFKYSRFGQ
ncbi:Sporulation protein RMD1 [Nosema bombycis CQ1]|uniref:Sporulation protein RMD1 n=1 Tax=Nosema bombycis (strain CQ1 / CVCC 102059) TaxID=578461 RepID=R0MF32_NOSB1|nr:Sporulation protein RMD1 [Nosema bombycis CQ1]|eukprot:EOB12745.1 Sporulation protein RMD1 [Nosema bombycis CQ1]